MLYFIIAFIATTLGAIAGLGGGIIIKPILDLMGDFNLGTISVLSSFTVFTMAIVATINRVSTGFELKRNMVVISIGAMIGGTVGGAIFNLLISSIPTTVVKISQSSMLIILLIIVLCKHKLPTFNVKNDFLIFLMGILLGSIAAFLGIGGGPINVAVLCMFLGYKVKDAAVVSVFIILFAQASKLLFILISTGFGQYDLSVLWFMVIGGVIGGLTGAKLNKSLSEEVISKIFNTMLVAIICINIYNIYNAFIG
ncbi:MAG: sulfite exporter TauE/SafE family protein [Lachnospirales bacterium]